MKESPTKLFLGSKILFLLVLVAAFFIGRVYQHISSGPGLFGPTYRSDSEVREKIEGHDYVIPEGATHLAYLSIGFEEPSTYISMKLPLSIHQSTIEDWLSRSKAEKKMIEESEYSFYDPHGYDWIDHDLSPFDLTNTNSIVGYKASSKPEDYEYAGFSNSGSGRVVLFSWFE
jgi:hypothetical protein